MRLHQPYMAISHDARISQVMMVPSWNLDERKCRTCGYLVAPQIAEVKHQWVAYEPPKTAAGIVAPTGQDIGQVLAMLNRRLG